MEIPSQYAPRHVEQRWYQTWLKHKAFASQPDHRPAYTIVIPPPNVTGVLHMGHMLNNTIQDVLVRRARMRGFNACWVPGTDHASIATEAKVVQKLRAEGVKKSDLSRDAFLEHAWAWTHKHGGIILEQLKELGASCDWDRTAFTMDEVRSDSVYQVFADLHAKGHIYRGLRMVHWDPEAKTSLSDEEVLHKDITATLYYVKYEVVEKPGTFLTVATSRPETIMGDVAVAINPKDERYTALHGLHVRVPIGGREVPIILDDYVTTDFGTGCLKVTPAHDWNDYAIGQKHGLEVLDVLNEDGTLSAHGLQYAGMERFAARAKVAEDLKASGHLAKTEDYASTVGTSERTGAVVEPRLSLQWWVRMPELAKPALDAVMSDEIQLIPEKFKNTYRHWMENVKDWCISRQLWWGHRIPAYFYGPGEHDYVVALSADEALTKAREASGRADLQASDLQQDPDCLDTWFSSWLWPLSVFDGIRNPENPEIQYYYPTQDLVTAPEILFFWVARMAMAGYEYAGKRPFERVYLTGIVRDKLGRKMSKSLGNSPDPIELMNTYGADGVRMGMLLTSPAGNDLPFDELLCEQGRNFTNKVWNALRLVKGWNVSDDAPADEAAEWAVTWFRALLDAELNELQRDFDRYALSEALMRLYKLTWNSFCAWYLELVKPAYGQPISSSVYRATVAYFEELMAALHPFMPFLTEEVWHLLSDRAETDFLDFATYPTSRGTSYDPAEFASVEAHVVALRTFRAEKNIAFKSPLTTDAAAKPAGWPAIAKLTNSAWGSAEGGLPLRAGTAELRVLIEAESVDVEAEIAKAQKDIEYYSGFKRSVLAKLSNEKFMAGAPAAVIDAERKKLADAEAKIEIAEKMLAVLTSN
ncbi:MAG: valine--tRNA ligase [Schleiferiaceae bacterium]